MRINNNISINININNNERKKRHVILGRTIAQNGWLPDPPIMALQYEMGD